MAELFRFFVIVGFFASPTYAQVIEVGTDGEATVYDAPAIFVDEGSSLVSSTRIIPISPMLHALLQRYRSLKWNKTMVCLKALFMRSFIRNRGGVSTQLASRAR